MYLSFKPAADRMLAVYNEYQFHALTDILAVRMTIEADNKRIHAILGVSSDQN